MAVQQFTNADLDAACDAGAYVLVDFYADWCGPCKTMAPHFEAAATGELRKKVTFAKIDTEAEQKLAMEAGIRSIPTTVLFAGNDELGRASGAMSRAQIEKFATDLIWQRENI
ncbi:MAG: thioredoxin 2 [Myxococcota bacterium]|jgi:thioredoxin 2